MISAGGYQICPENAYTDQWWGLWDPLKVLHLSAVDIECRVESCALFHLRVNIFTFRVTQRPPVTAYILLTSLNHISRPLCRYSVLTVFARDTQQTLMAEYREKLEAGK